MYRIGYFDTLRRSFVIDRYASYRTEEEATVVARKSAQTAIDIYRGARPRVILKEVAVVEPVDDGMCRHERRLRRQTRRLC